MEARRGEARAERTKMLFIKKLAAFLFYELTVLFFSLFFTCRRREEAGQLEHFTSFHLLSVFGCPVKLSGHDTDTMSRKPIVVPLVDLSNLTL